MQRGHAHPRNFGEFFHAQRLGIVGAQPGNGFRRAMTEIAGGGDGAEAFALRCLQNPVDDFRFDQVTEKRYVLGSFKQIDHSRHCAEQRVRILANSKPPAF